MKKLVLLLTCCTLCLISIAQTVQIPDANFRIALTKLGIDNNNDGLFQLTEVRYVDELDVSDSDITDFTGIEAFIGLKTFNASYNRFNTINLKSNDALENVIFNSTNLIGLDLTGNPELKTVEVSSGNLWSIDVSQNFKLTKLRCAQNNLESLDVSNNIQLENLECGYNDLKTINLENNTSLNYLRISHASIGYLDLTNNHELEWLILSSNHLPSIDLSQNPNLLHLSIGFNRLTEIDLSNNLKLEGLSVESNKFTNLDLKFNQALELLNCRSNELTQLDLSLNPKLNRIDCAKNNIRILNIKNGSICRSIHYFDIYDNPNIKYICADAEELAVVQEDLDNNGYTCELNTYCTYVLGGEKYSVTGNIIFDNDNNGCDTNDYKKDNNLIKVLDENNELLSYSLQNSNYLLSFNSGQYIYQLQNIDSALFNIHPKSYEVNFENDNVLGSQDFCISPREIFEDVNISIIPVDIARPGFDSKYRLIYTNEGTQIISGQITLNFPSEYVEYLSSSAELSAQYENSLVWNYSELHPFESRQIDVLFNLNSPIENPALNHGDTIKFSTHVDPVKNDRRMPDNSACLEQEVVNSWDPNDKTCLEGSTIIPEMAGEYIHYKIRFENTGSASAINIVVKDFIDPTQFDIGSLHTVDSSHEMKTNIVNKNEIEFYFENIELPFHDDLNDGYVTFKIKTLPSLTLGDKIENTAEIYFDYNFPIVTNTATTEFIVISAVEEEPKIEGETTSRLFPNPATEKIYLNTKQPISFLSFYDSSGRLLVNYQFVEETNEQIISIDHLQSGLYYLSFGGEQYTCHKILIVE